MNGSSALTKNTTQVFGTGTSTTTWDYYLNNTWLPTSDTTNRALLDEGKYYLGEYGDAVSYKTTICKDSDLSLVNTKNCTRYTDSEANKTYTGYVGLLRVGEMFSSQLKGTLSSYQFMWLITPYSSSLVRRVYYGGNLTYGDPSSATFAVRPTVNLKSNVIITDGDGTEQHPFQIALGS